MSGNRALQARQDEPDAAHVFPNAHTFLEKPLDLIRIEALEHVGRIDRINQVRTKPKPVPNFQPNVNLVEELAADIQETRKVLCTATKVQMTDAPLAGCALIRYSCRK